MGSARGSGRTDLGDHLVTLPRPARRRPEHGAAAVEFALVLPVLILILGAIIDFGFIFSQQIAFNTSARDAARAGVLPSMSGTPPTCGQVAAKARVGASSGAVGVGSPQSIAVTVTGAGGTCSLAAGSTSAGGDGGSFPCTGSDASATTDLQVELSYASSPPFPVPFMGPVTLGSKGNFQCEYK